MADIALSGTLPTPGDKFQARTIPWLRLQGTLSAPSGSFAMPAPRNITATLRPILTASVTIDSPREINASIRVATPTLLTTLDNQPHAKMGAVIPTPSASIDGNLSPFLRFQTRLPFSLRTYVYLERKWEEHPPKAAVSDEEPTVGRGYMS